METFKVENMSDAYKIIIGERSCLEHIEIEKETKAETLKREIFENILKYLKRMYGIRKKFRSAQKENLENDLIREM